MAEHLKCSMQLFLFVLLSLLYFANAITDDELEDILLEHDVDNLFGLNGVPDEFLQVTYPNDYKLTTGDKPSVLQISSPPQVSWNADPSENYTLLLLDSLPYLKRRHQSGESDRVVYWLVTNITGGDVNTGQVLESYISPQPSTLEHSKAEHDFVFVIFKNKEHDCLRREMDKAHADLLQFFRENFIIRGFGTTYRYHEPECVFKGAVAWNFFTLVKTN